jgi:hypothetical protein
MKLNIENPNKLVEVYKTTIPQWVMWYRGENEKVYKFGLNTDKRLKNDEFEIHIGKTIKVGLDDETGLKEKYVVLKLRFVESGDAVKREIKLRWFKNVETFIEIFTEEFLEELMCDIMMFDSPV